jgi:hypothetical protein
MAGNSWRSDRMDRLSSTTLADRTGPPAPGRPLRLLWDNVVLAADQAARILPSCYVTELDVVR